MHKKLILGLLTFAMAVAAYLVLSSGDQGSAQRSPQAPSEAVRRFVSSPTTQATRSIREGEVSFKPGEGTLARLYDDVTGRLKYQFEAKTWEPVSETDFRLKEPLIQIFMPRGEITYVSADEAQVTLARRSGSRFEPKNGWLRGHVKVIVDRTTAEWRQANPDLADRYAHPEDLISIDMEDARFDLDQAELVSDGNILVDGSEVRIENVKGLTLQWDQVDNRIDNLRFKQGGRMILRRGGKLVDFALPGTQRDAKKPDRSGQAAASPGGEAGSVQQPTGPAGTVAANKPIGAGRESGAPAAGGEIPRALAMKPQSIKAITADEAAAEIREQSGAVLANRPRSAAASGRPAPTSPAAGQSYQLRSADVLASEADKMKAEARGDAAPAPTQSLAAELVEKKQRKRIHTYRAVFDNQVVVEQKDGLRTIGKLESDRLEINFDFGEKQRALTGTGRRDKAPSTGQPVEPGGPGQEPGAVGPPEAVAALEQDQTRLTLTWNGPLEMRPLQVDPAEQTGQRFDAIATGVPVRVESEQGRGVCERLVYRHERRQVWLAGSDVKPVGLSVSEYRRLEGREVFFDQARGLAVVDGPGMMIDARSQEREAAAEAAAREQSGAEVIAAKSGRKPREDVEIRWARGVDIELGYRVVQQINASTGLREDKRREFLQRAWFHEDVSVKQGEEWVTADEVAVTFGLPTSSEEMADHIEHLNMAGEVRLQRKDELITADRLDAEMILTADGRNVPRIVNGDGHVRVAQQDREIRAGQMHVVLGEVRPDTARPTQGDMPTFSDSRLGIESLEARGSVYVKDPEHNLKISKAHSLDCTMRGGNQLAHAVIKSKNPGVFAQTRYEDVAIHGHHVELDLDAQTVDVPGPGKAWMLTHQDFTGKRLRTPEPVKTTWTSKMEFRLAQDYGRFEREVHSEAQSFTLDCDVLTLRFARVPPVREDRKEGPIERLWKLGGIAGDKAQAKEAIVTGLNQESKRPVHVVAEGNAQAASAEYARTDAEGQPGRLLNRLWVSGDRIAADLAREQLSVPGRGNLLIEDYQFEAEGEKVKLSRAGSGGSPLMSTLRSEGPSQTAVGWENSMDYFLDRGLVAFDKKVQMVHRSGQEMVLKDKLVETMRIDRQNLGRLSKGRTATLSCGHLLLEFLTVRDGAASSNDPTTVRATDLKRLIAQDAVHLQDGTKSLMGEYLQYVRETNEIRLEGSAALEARIVDQDEAEQRLTMWRGPLLIWDRATNHIEAPGASIRASRR